MTGSNEFFYRDANGRKQDAELHEEMLDNPQANALGLMQVRAQLRESGKSPELIDRLYPLPDPKLLDELDSDGAEFAAR